MQEKEPIGCTLIQDEYILFDKEGIVIGKSPIQPEKLLFIEGMQAEEVTVGEELPVPEKESFGISLRFRMPLRSIRSQWTDWCAAVQILLPISAVSVWNLEAVTWS